MSDTPRFPRLLSPLKLGKLRLRNRIVMTAHVTNLADTDRMATVALRDYYLERVRGETGLIIMESQAVHQSAGATRLSMGAWDDEVIGRYRLITDPVHDEGGLIFTQLNHGGREHSSFVTRLPLVAPSPIASSTRRELPHELLPAEINTLVGSFAGAARRARSGGFDGVEVHAGHGYLLHQFLSPLTNQRSDQYGGGLANRLRFTVEVLSAVRAEVGSDFLLGVRISGDELTRGGLGVAEMKSVAAQLRVRCEIDYISVSVGSYASIETIIPDMSFGPAPFVHIAGDIKKAVPDLPVIAVGGITTPGIAEHVLETQRVDLIGMTRALIADPWLARKTRHGDPNDIRRCIGCNQGCVTRVANGVEIGCLQNPDAGRERAGTEHAWRTASAARRIAVIGAGPAGLEAAFTAASLGHSVTLFEATSSIGGQIRTYVGLPSRSEFRHVIEWRERQLRRLDVEVILQSKVDVRAITAQQYDAVVVATGAQEDLPHNFPADGRTLGAIEALGRELPDGATCLIFDDSAGPMGMTVCEILLSRHLRVTLATSAPQVGDGVIINTRKPFLARLLGLGAEFFPQVQLVGWEEDEVVLSNSYTGRQIRVPADFLILVDVRRAGDDFVRSGQLRGPLELVGDAMAPRDVTTAIREGRDAALRIHEAFAHD